MQKVSQAWKDAQRRTIAPPSFLEIAVGVGDPDAQSMAECSDNGHETFSKVQNITDEGKADPVKYATLEPGLWLLNGTCRLFEDDTPDGPDPDMPPAVVGKAIVGRSKIGEAVV